MDAERESDFSDAELLDRICKADNSSFRILLNRHSRGCYRVAYRILHDKEQAEDVVQDVMLKIWQDPTIWSKNKAKSSGAKFKTWLYRVVINGAIDQYRKNKRKVRIFDWVEFETEKVHAGDTQANQDKQMDLQNLTKIVNDIIQTLPVNYSTALVLCRMENMSYKEAAEVMGISPKAVERCISRAVKKLRSKLDKQNLNLDEFIGY